jgi:hypothetical protein
MREMYLWFSIMGWAAAVIVVTAVTLFGCRKRQS